MEQGLAAWSESDDLHVDVAADGYTLRASHDGAPLQSSDTVDSLPFAITAGAPGRIAFSRDSPGQCVPLHLKQGEGLDVRESSSVTILSVASAKNVSASRSFLRCTNNNPRSDDDRRRASNDS